MGGIGTKPWRNRDAELALEGKRVSAERFAAAAQIILSGVKPQPGNAFKVELGKRCLVHALKLVTAEA